MSDITADVQETIDEILRLTADHNAVSLTSACKDYLAKKIFPGGELKPGISTSVIPLVLPTILKCFAYDDPLLQQEGAFFIDAAVSTPNQKKHAKLVIDKGVIPLLINNLSSKVIKVLNQTLACLGKIAVYYPCVVIENGILQPLHECLQSKNRRVYFHAVKCLAILVTNCQEKVYDFLNVKVKTIEALIKIVESHGRNGGAENRYSLANLLLPNFNDVAALGSLKAVFNWLLAEKPKVKKNDKALYTSEERKIIKLLAFQVIKNAISLYGKAAVDIIHRELFFQPIVKHIFGAVATADIKIAAIKIIEGSVAAKPDFLLSLIDDYDIISVLSKNLLKKTEDLLAACLRILKNAIEKCNDACRRKINDFGGLGILEKLVEHKKKEISEPSKFIYDFVNVEPAAAVDGRDGENDEIERDDGDSRIASVEHPQSRHQSRQPHKRAATPLPDEGTFTRSSKRSRTANVSYGNEHSDNFMNANIFGGVDDHPGNSSSLNLDTVAAPAESNRNNSSSRRQSVAASTDDGTVRNGFNAGSPHGDNGNQLTGPPLSHVSNPEPEAASIRNVLSVNQPPPPPPRHQSLAHQNVAVAASGAPPINLNPRNESSTSANLSRSSSRISSALPPPAATDHRTPSTLPNNNNPVKKESPSRPSTSPDLPIPSSTDGRNQSACPRTSRTSLQLIPAASRNNNHFALYEYLYPAEAFIKKCCQENFGFKFNLRLRDKFLEFVRKIHIQHVGITSKPFVSYPTNDETGFGCISLLFTGTENNASIIRDKINENYVKLIKYDREKITTVINSSFLLNEHLETICRWLECRVMVYCSEKWELYGDWNSADNQKLPLFLLEKKTIKENEIYQVVMSVENEVIDLE